MKTRDLLTITAFALGTATLTVATFLAGPLDAGTETSPPAVTITKPKLVTHGVELTVAPAEGCPFKAGEQPVLDLHAVNTLEKPANVTVRITMQASTPVSPLSRALPVPTLLWQEQRLLTFQPNETKTVSLNAQTNLPTNSIIYVALAEVDLVEKRADADPAKNAPVLGRVPAGGGGVVVLSFSTVEPKTDSAYAAVIEKGRGSDLVNRN